MYFLTKGSCFRITILFLLVLTHDSARIHVIAGHAKANKAADALFESYQSEAFTYPRGFFRRYPLQSVSDLRISNP